MATLRDLWRGTGASKHHILKGDTKKGREVIRESAKKSGGPTPELKRVYGEFLAYKRTIDASRKN